MSVLVLPFFLFIVDPNCHDDFARFVLLCVSASVIPLYIVSLIII